MREHRTRSAAVDAPPSLQHRVTALDLRAAATTEAGEFEGYACVWDVRDSYGTSFAPGCFGAGGLDRAERAYALLWMHDVYEPVGTFTAREDDRGLWVAGAWDDTVDGRDSRTRARTGSAPGLSVGFVVMTFDPDADHERFLQARLVETSQITARMAAVPGAEIASARSARTVAARRARGRLALAPTIR